MNMREKQILTSVMLPTALRSADFSKIGLSSWQTRYKDNHVFREIRHLVVLSCSARIAS